MLEKTFQVPFINFLRDRYPGAIVIKTDPSYIRSFPDLLFLFGRNWAAFEAKRGVYAPKQPNQDYYVETLDNMSFARFVNKRNYLEVVHEMEQTFQI